MIRIHSKKNLQHQKKAKANLHALTFSLHAEKRQQQRGIKDAQLAAVIYYGKEAYSNKAMSYFLTKDSEREMLSDGFHTRFIDKCKRIYVISKDSIIITICHCY